MFEDLVLFRDTREDGGWTVCVEAPHFVAGFVVSAGGVVLRAAPILAWVKTQPTTRDAVKAVKGYGYKVTIWPNETIADAS